MSRVAKKKIYYGSVIPFFWVGSQGVRDEEDSICLFLCPAGSHSQPDKKNVVFYFFFTFVFIAALLHVWEMGVRFIVPAKRRLHLFEKGGGGMGLFPTQECNIINPT